MKIVNTVGFDANFVTVMYTVIDLFIYVMDNY